MLSFGPWVDRARSLRTVHLEARQDLLWGLGLRVWGLGFGIWGLGFGVWGLGFGVWGLGFGVRSLGFGSSFFLFVLTLVQVLEDP